jgi:hypothetical protein
MLIRQDAAGHIHHHLHAFKQLALELIALANNQLDVCSAFSQNKLYFLFSRLPSRSSPPKGVYFTIWKPFCNPGPVLPHWLVHH